MMNWIWMGFVVFSILCAGFNDRMPDLFKSTFTSAEDAVTLALKLLGVMTLWLGIMRVAQDGGLLKTIARGLQRPMRWLFPDVPSDHPAMSSMIMTFAANILGLGNAATPVGIKAMAELDQLNQRKGTATNAMCLFLAINTSGLSILPTGTINMRAMSGSTDPACIWLPTLLASVCSITVAIISAKLLMRLGRYQLPVQASTTPTKAESEANAPKREDLPAAQGSQRAGWVTMLVVWFCAVGFVAAAGWYFYRKVGTVDGFGLTKEFFSYWALPALMGGLLLFGLARNVRVYESLVEGAKEGFQVTVRIIPYLVALFVAVGMFTASGAMDLLKESVGAVTNAIGLPVELLPLAIIRPLSGSGSFSYMTSLFNQYGPDSFIGQMASVMQGSMDTTLYILAVYFGSVQIRKVRYALAAGLLVDLGGIIAAVVLSHLFFQ